METIGERVKRRRKQLGIPRRQLAEEVGLSYSMLSDLEAGKAKTTTALHRIADRLTVNVNWLETGRGTAETAKSAADPWIAIEELRIAHALQAKALAESIPTAGRALLDELVRLPQDLRERDYLTVLIGTLRRVLASQDADALRAPARKAPGSAGRKRA